MAPVAFLLGGFIGTFAAVVGWLFFGLSFWAGVQVYFLAGLLVALPLIALSLLRPAPTADTAAQNLQRA